ncbi:MAG: adenosylcobinamide-GDP ribazoletransferase [Candidatus Omnitrophica bacterium]|nr:adenosylcobinamide-GDP ribazoletransferase [Candidatus Omnitrophota bacterium]
MKSFFLALQFLTIIPIKFKNIQQKQMARAMIYFPLAGLILGIILAGENYFLLLLGFPRLATNIILVVSLIALTGGMHLDGLADTVDAFCSGKSKDEALAIMREPRIGTMGALSLISVILLKIGLLYSLGGSLKITALLLMCVFSRWSTVWAMFLSGYAREEGKAKAFIQGMNLKIFLLSLLITAALAAAIWRIEGLITLLIIAGCVYSGVKFTQEKIGGITGDTLGATVELTELLSIIILAPFSNLIG